MVEVKVPATSANIGPGFDCLGLAVKKYNRFVVEEIEEGLVFEGCEEEFKNEENLIYVSMKKCFDKLNYTPTGLSIKIEGDIPVSRGLGSSAACVVGGVLAANGLTGSTLSKEEVLNLAAEMEGHPDNITPALFGGMTVSVSEENKTIYNKINIKEEIKLCALIPDFKLSTDKARAVLPKTIDYKQGVYNIGRVALMISALSSGNLDLLKIACKDKLHEDYRAELIENFYDIKNKCSEFNALAVFLSGAGPTIMVMLRKDDSSFLNNIRNYLDTLRSRWEVLELDIDNEGAQVKVL
ncbi:homoserine kinase [Clostridium sp. C8-1-8]|uniref:homoserine kinase n=1 Tax=Clostridium sp. C8-1-8 TaxID=2698831 RepID=UPI00136F15DD|nr:homoserine kinase [Clostridium sp. C8-1-8]